MNLSELYDKYEIENDRICCKKRILLICPSRNYDWNYFVNKYLLDDSLYEITFPKCDDNDISYQILMSEIVDSEAELKLQLDCKITKKIPFWTNNDESNGISDKIVNIRGDVFVNLHHHDEFSIRDGLGTIKDLVVLLNSRKQSVCAVTNHGSIGGWIKQYNVCKKNGIKSIFGIEAYVNEYRGDDIEERKKFRKNNHLCMWARNEEGFYNIIKMHNDAQINGFYYSPRCDYNHIKKWGKGIISSSGCYSGDIAAALQENDFDKAKKLYEIYKDAFDEFYIELTMIEWDAQIEMNKKLIQFANEVGAPMIVTLDSHYLYPEYAETHDILLLIRKGKTILDKIENSEEVWQFDVRNLYYRNEEQLRDLWKDLYKSDIFTEDVLNEAINNTRRIVMKCENINLDSTVRLPKLYPDANQELRDRALIGLKKRGLDGVVGYNDRLNFELDVIIKMGYADYFLVVEKIVSDTKSEFGDMSVGWGRGCFTPKSLVLMQNGIYKYIDNIKIGDKVIADDKSVQIVENLFEYHVDEYLIEVVIDDSVSFKCTKDHVIFVKTDNGIIEKKAKDLIPGDILIKVDSNSSTSDIIKYVRLVKYSGKVYDLKVSNRHTYNVEGFAVHNSAGGSLVAYVLRITDLDPIKYGLLFERFLDYSRTDDFPDIDLDFIPSIRGWVKNHIFETFGKEHVCSIGTYQTYRTKAVIIDVARALGLDVWEANQVTKSFDSLATFDVGSGEDAEEMRVDDMPFEEIFKHYPEVAEYAIKYPEVIKHAAVLRNQVKNMGKHAGGMIISDLDLRDRIPVISDGEQVISAWCEGMATHELSSVGLVKFDILGLGNLSIIDDTLKLIEKTYGKRIRKEDLDIDNKNAIRESSRKDLLGIFQFEHPSTKGIADAVRMENIYDIGAVTSLIRPGPRTMGMDKEYADRKHLRKKYSIPSCIKDILGETHGVICIHENTMISLIDNTEIPIKEMYKGCEVYSYNLLNCNFEFDVCDGAKQTKFCDGIEVSLENNFSVILTNDHNVLTIDGYKEAQYLCKNDLVVCGIKNNNGYNVGYYRIKNLNIVCNQVFYGMSVRKNHNLIANGIVVKNCYQEQVMLIAQKLGGFSAAESNKLRKVLVKEKNPEILENMHNKFLNGAKSRILSGEVSEEDIENWWQLCKSFAGYGFNKSHAFEYAAVSSVEFWLKHNYPLEYMTALINNAASSTSKKGMQPQHVRYINYARKLGIEILGPSVNKSGSDYRIEDGKIRFSLNHIKQVGKSADIIEGLQPFISIEDFYTRVPKRKVNKRVVTSLIYAGAFDEFGNKNEVLEQFSILRKDKKKYEFESDLFFQEKEKEVIGLCLNVVPILFEYSNEIKKNKWVTIADLDTYGNAYVFGRISNIVRTTSKAGNEMMIVTITDDIDTIKFYVWSNAFLKFTREAKKGFIVAMPLQKFEDSNTRFYNITKQIVNIKK